MKPPEPKRVLLPHHTELIAKSSISDEVAAARGYYTATTRGELEALGFRPYQALSPALVNPVYDVTGKVALYQIRPDCPRVKKTGKAIKYETPSGARMVVDVPPAIRGKLADPTVPLWITEGIRKADAAVSAGLCCVALLGVDCWRGTNAEGGKVVLACWDSIALNGRHVFLCFDSDVVTKKEVKGALARLRAFLEQRGARVHLVYLPDGADGSKVGLDDYLAAGHTVDELRGLADAQPTSKPCTNETQSKPTGPAPPLAPLLKDTLAFLRRYVVFAKSEQSSAATLWTAHTHIFQQFEATPYLHVTSATKQSGKTRFLDALEHVVAKPWRAVLPSEAVVYRKIAKVAPTLMLDEVDALYGEKAKEHENLRALLNAGHRKGTTVPRCVGDGSNWDIEEFEVYCPKALAGIGELPDTVSDRSIRIRLARRRRSEPVAPFRARDAKAEAAPLQERFAAWAASVDLSEARPVVPKSLSDRAADCWEPLLAIADAASGEWPELARKAAESLFRDGQEDDTNLGVRLLVDVRCVFESHANPEAIFTESLLGALNELEDAPWGDWRGKPFTARALARLLKPFGISRGGTIRVGHETRKGYRREQFAEAWDRYAPPLPEGPEKVTRSQLCEFAGLRESSDGNGTVTKDQKVTEFESNSARVTYVTDKPAPQEADAESAIGSEELF